MAVRYQKLLDAISRMTGLDTTEARRVAEAAMITLARQLSRADRRRLRAALPAELRDGFPAQPAPTQPDPVTFVQAVAALSDRPAEEAWLLTHAVFAALAEQEPDLVRELDLPDRLGELFTRPDPGGGVTGPHGHQAPLTPEQVEAELRGLPYWTGDTTALVRTVELPEENLARVLEHIQIMRERLGRGPVVHRGDGSADLVVSTGATGTVTAQDVALAHEIDRVIDEAGAGIASG